MTLQAINKEWYHTLYCSNSIKITWEQRNRTSSYSENGELEYQVKDTHQSMPTCAAHLRDTRKTRLYPSVNAITAFAFAARVCFCLDFLCFVVFYSKGPFTLAIFAAILAAIFAAILLRFQIAVESPVVYTGDLKSP